MTRQLYTDVAIVGGGIVGASAALALRRMGMQVALLERGVCGASASGVNYGGVRRQGRPLSQLPLAQRAHRIWGDLPRLIGTDGEYVRSGHFKIARRPADLAALEAYRAASRDFELDLRLLSKAQLRAQAPWLGDAALGGSLCPGDGHANPRRVAPAFAWAARERGAQLLEHCPVDDWDHDGHCFVLRSSAAAVRVRAPVLINAAGAWAGALAQRFGDRVPLTSGHPAMAVTEPLPRFMAWSLGVEGGGFYCRQVERGNVVMGGGAGHALGTERARVGGAALLVIAQQAAQMLPALRAATIIRTWSGVEGYLPDHLPVLGASPAMPGLLHAFGFSGAGFQIGPAVGEVLAELVRDGRSTTPIDAFAVNRFVAPAEAGPRAAHAVSVPPVVT
ncbi:NAD(P)/FAD-dependent oxidoreductase [Ottowia testudinis]|uniref:FAD-binding oxidoreductase n=1 Tax=Ottowia testudinis TaxID=2816950 RepID=A0A975CH42_9BURK|nr:FAD-dependent oxidoreductase [Ottowia testudinis]QTD45696.1 FAD-binding oxidoreductase [Ottowia testudinis]